ncbi:DNA topoisomerase 2-binding protein 1 [Gaertneriomyces sp. JEL0708]|nr:DNA topoisomerase 2-binding protein 1 [Gaertneriomyces sp. JEL0708]
MFTEKEKCSQILRGQTLSCTGLPSEEKENLRRAVIDLGGSFVDEIEPLCTQLLARTAGTPTYRKAIKYRIPILSPEWVRLCHSKRNEDFDPFDSAVLSKYALPPFAGLKVSVTGFPTVERQGIRELVTKYGGIFAPGLTDDCTHLIAEAPTGAKYEQAFKWNVQVVTIEWFNESVDTRISAEEDQYRLEDGNADDVGRTVNEDVMEGGGSGESNVKPPNLRRTTSSFAQLTYLDPCNVFLGDGFSEEEVRELKRIVRHGGGAVTETFDGFVTHYVVRGHGPTVNDTKVMRTHKNSVPVISQEWLRACGRERCAVSLEGYLVGRSVNFINDRSKSKEESESLAIKSRNDRPSRSGLETFFGEGTRSRASVPAGPFKQTKVDRHLSTDGSLAEATHSIPSTSEGPRGTAKASTRHSSAFSTSSLASFSADRGDVNPNEIVQPTGKRSVSTRKGPSLFSGCDFYCKGFSEEELLVLKAAISKYAGRYSSTVPRLDSYWLLLPFHLKASSAMKGVRLVTEYWIDRCIHAGKLLDPADLVIYRPTKHELPLAGFKHLIIGISGYHGIERDHLGRLVRVIGADFTETLSKKNTHLLSPRGLQNLKTQKASEWNVKIVDAEWLYECTAAGRLLPTNEDGCDQSNVPDMLPSMDEAVTTESSTAFEPKFDTGRALSSLQTPVQPTHIAQEETVASPLELSFRRHLSKALAHVSNHPPESIPEGNEQQLQDRPLSHLLKGVTICISQRLAHRRTELQKVAARLGAEFLNYFTVSCTHYMHQSSRSSESFKDFKTARQKGKYIVSPEWLIRCEESGRRVNESDFPHTFNPHKTLSLATPAPVEASDILDIAPSPSMLTLRNAGRTLNARTMSTPIFDNPEAMDIKLDGIKAAVTAAASPAPTPTGNVLRKSTSMPAKFPESPLSTKERVDKYAALIDQLLQAKPNPSTPKAPLTSRASSGIGLVGHNERDSSEMALRTHHEVVDLCTQPSADLQKELQFTITYDDPNSRVEKRKLIEQLESSEKRMKVSQATSFTATNDGNRQGAGNIEAEGTDEPENAPPVSTNEADVTASGQRSSRPSPLSSVRRTASAASASSIRNNTCPTSRRLSVHSNTEQKTAPVAEASVMRAHCRKFMVSGLHRDSRKPVYEIIAELGGEVIDSDCWDPACTHLIVAKPSRTEKFLAAVSSGAWVLRPAYVEACRQAGRFLEEEAYEWIAGSETPAHDRDFYDAPRRWRKRLTEETGNRKGSFDGWHVLLIVEDTRREGFRRMLEAGGATVVAHVKSSRKLPVENFTHCIADSDALKKSSPKRLLQKLANDGVTFVETSYCSDYLFTAAPVSPTKWRLQVLD